MTVTLTNVKKSVLFRYPFPGRSHLGQGWTPRYIAGLWEKCSIKRYTRRQEEGNRIKFRRHHVAIDELARRMPGLIAGCTNEIEDTVEDRVHPRITHEHPASASISGAMSPVCAPEAAAWNLISHGNGRPAHRLNHPRNLRKGRTYQQIARHIPGPAAIAPASAQAFAEGPFIFQFPAIN